MAKKEKKKETISNALFELHEQEETLYYRVAIRSWSRTLFPGSRLDNPGVKLSVGYRGLDCWQAVIAALPANDAMTAKFPRSIRERWLHCSPCGYKAYGNDFEPRRCHAYHWCPFCRGRQAANTWSRFDDLLFPRDPVTREKPDKARYDFITRYQKAPLDEYCLDPVTGKQHVATLASLGVRAGTMQTSLVPLRSRSVEMNRLKSVAAVEVMAFDFEPETKRVLARVNQLFVVPAKVQYALPAVACEHSDWRRSATTRTELADALIQVYQYPRGLLESSPMTHQMYLVTTKDARMVAHYGLARRAKKTTPAAEAE